MLFLLVALLFKDCENLLKVLFLNLRDLLRFFSAVVTSPARPGTGLSEVVAQEDFSALFRLRISLHIVQLFGEHMFVEVGRLDRKSTRLNSSHVAISYAVFCLKKKRTITDR